MAVWTMDADNLGELVLLLSLGATEPRPHHVRITKKALSGLALYRKLWGGPVRAILPPGPAHTGNLDEVDVDTRTLDFAIEVLDPRSPAARARMRSAAVVMGGADYTLNGTAQFCRDAGVPYVFNSEYTLRTRWQIARSEQKNRLRLLRRLVWEWQQERAFEREVALASAVQCNGTPTYESYRSLAQDVLLYFDTRTDGSLLASDAHVELRARRRQLGGPLRLAFSGRLAAMKGVDHLPALASALRARGVPFTLDVCGDGPLRAELERDVAERGLSDCVRFRGVLDFARELVPWMRSEVDVFVCCHRQGDPSCTYLETFGCGVPIVGYANEALKGLLERVSAGVTVPIDDVEALADAIADLGAPDNAEALKEAGLSALRFARGNTFETTFARRVAHLREVAQQREPSAKSA
jgi:colanic acid/amylovoran biosynthesis glycosyltransferase